MPLDERGLRVDRARRARRRRGRLRAVYLTPHHQYPTLAVLSPERRLALLELARRHRFAIVEDDYDYEMHYEGRPLLPLASADTAGVVVYVGTLSKILAPGVRVGYVGRAAAAARALRGCCAARSTARAIAAVECAVAELLEDGVSSATRAAMRRLYRARRDALAAALRRELADALRFERAAAAAWRSGCHGARPRRRRLARARSRAGCTSPPRARSPSTAARAARRGSATPICATTSSRGSRADARGALNRARDQKLHFSLKITRSLSLPGVERGQVALLVEQHADAAVSASSTS